MLMIKVALRVLLEKPINQNQAAKEKSIPKSLTPHGPQ